MSDLDRALAFYRDALGLRVVRRAEETGRMIETILALPGVQVTTVKLAAEEAGVQIELLRFHSHADGAPRQITPYSIGPTHLAFTVSSVDAVCELLSARGLPLLSLPQISDDGSAKVVFCRDPDGALIELVEMLDQPAARRLTR